jgi:dihydrofolate reductase
VILTVIVAVADNGIIGRAGDLPWHLPADLRRFKQLTVGHPIVMGRKTWESIGRPLPGRTSIVLTRREEYPVPEGVLRARSLDEALALVPDADEVFVIGGEAVYAEALARADRLHRTRVHAAPAGDARFPEIDPTGWKLVRSESREPDARHEHALTFETWERA